MSVSGMESSQSLEIVESIEPIQALNCASWCPIQPMQFSESGTDGRKSGWIELVWWRRRIDVNRSALAAR